MERRFFGVVDYIVFGTSLVVSLGIGVWFSLSGGRQRTNREYLLGNRSMGWFPVALSLLASTIAAGTVLGHPAEMYLYGTTFAFAWVGINLAAPVAAWVWVPLLHPLKLTSANEYLEMRFGSIAVRRLNCVYAYLSFITFSGVCLFGPSVAIELVTGFPVWGAIILSGGIATIYTSIGGMKAVIWTDVFQALTMLAGILAVTIQGCILVGGGNKVWNTAERGGRILADTSVDPRTRMTVLGAAVGQFIMWFFTSGVWQPAVQRFSSVDNLRSAQWSVIGTLSGTLTIGPLACFAGIVMFAYYFLMGCDPLAANYITTPDQLMVHFVMEVLDYPGVPGLFVAATLSSSLSSSSSCINSASAILWEDLLSYRFPQASESTAASIAKISGAVTGVLSILTALATLYTGGTIVHAVIRFTQGALVPTAVLFVLAAAIPCANEKLTVDSTGVKTHTVPAWKRYINVRKGDLIGIENMWGEPAMIPYDGEECEGKNASTLFFSIPKTAYRYEVFKELPAGSKPCRKYSVQLHCKEGFAHGPRPMDRPKQDSATKEMYVMNSNLPWTGKLVSWELYSKRAGEIYLGVFRGTLNNSETVGMRRQYTLVASKKYVLPESGFHHLKLASSEQLDVQKGDRLGFYFNHGNPIPYSTGLCYREGNGYPREGDAEMWYKAPRIIRMGKTYNMKLVRSDVEFPDCRHYSIQATIMPKED